MAAYIDSHGGRVDRLAVIEEPRRRRIPPSESLAPQDRALRSVLRGIRKNDPKASSFRKWAKKVRKLTGFGGEHTYRQIQRWERGEGGPIPVDYVVACAIAGGVEIRLGSLIDVVEKGGSR